MEMFRIRDAVPADMPVLRDVFRASSLSHEGDRGTRRIEVTANPHALGFYEKAGFVVAHDVRTRFGPASRMHLDVAP
jgi:hypothetical protein